MAWRIEQAKSDRATCRFCNKRIAKGEHRFGNDELTSDWYHLACAPEGKPRAFKPFAAEAAKLGAGASQPTAAAPVVDDGSARHLELEAKLAADPADRETRAVFADWLQSRGDPWGELIALELAGKKAEAKRLLKQHAEALTGGFGARGLTWKRGFIDDIGVDGSLKSAKLSLPGLLGLRTAFLTRRLRVAMSPDAELVRLVNERAPKGLRDLFVWLSPAVDGLALPSIEKLTLMVQRDRPCAAEALPTLLSGARLPRLRALAFFQAPLTVDFLRALVDSKLCAQLESLAIYQNALSPEGQAFLDSRRRALAHLKTLSFEPDFDDDPEDDHDD